MYENTFTSVHCAVPVLGPRQYYTGSIACAVREYAQPFPCIGAYLLDYLNHPTSGPYAIDLLKTYRMMHSVGLHTLPGVEIKIVMFVKPWWVVTYLSNAPVVAGYTHDMAYVLLSALPEGTPDEHRAVLTTLLELAKSPFNPIVSVPLQTIIADIRKQYEESPWYKKGKRDD